MKLDNFVLYAYPFPSRAERVLWTLKELDYSYKVVRLDPFKGETGTVEFTKLNPSGKIPVLVHNGEVFTESLAIMEYLNDISDSKKLVPSAPKKSFEYRKVVHYGLTEIEPYLWIAEQASKLNGLYSWPDGTYKDAISKVKENIVLVWGWLENGQYISNNEFTLADIYFYHLITWLRQHEIDCPKEACEYTERLENRECFPVEMLSN